MNEYINCIRNGKIDEFRRKYRERCDVLLMDDIQFLAGKDRTQDEFFHTFNSLFESHRQIVLTADKYPHEIPDLEERLRSRFQSGLIADIQPPELETRIAILKKKAEMDDINLPDDVAIYLATNIKSNVRELEGLLIRVAAFAGLQEQPITIEFAKETLKNFLTQAAHSLTVEAVQKEVANYFNVKLTDMKSPKRHQAIARPRQIAMYLARKLCKASYPELGQRFGGKDHTTVLSACRKIEALVRDRPQDAPHRRRARASSFSVANSPQLVGKNGVRSCGCKCGELCCLCTTRAALQKRTHVSRHRCFARDVRAIDRLSTVPTGSNSRTI